MHLVQRSPTSDERIFQLSAPRRNGPQVRRAERNAGSRLGAWIKVEFNGHAAPFGAERGISMRLFIGLACAVMAAPPALAQHTGAAASGECAVVPILSAAIPVVEVTIG